MGRSKVRASRQSTRHTSATKQVTGVQSDRIDFPWGKPTTKHQTNAIVSLDHPKWERKVRVHNHRQLPQPLRDLLPQGVTVESIAWSETKDGYSGAISQLCIPDRPQGSGVNLLQPNYFHLRIKATNIERVGVQPRWRGGDVAGNIGVRVGGGGLNRT